MTHDKHHRTAEKDRVPVLQKIGFGFGAMAQCLGSYSIGNLANFVFNIGLGVNPFLVGLAQSIPRLWDALSDPLMGHLSDNTRTRWGRRRPYLFVGSIFTGVLFAAIWCLPAGWSERAYFAYFLGMSLLYYTALTVFMVPWGALGLEMTKDYHERTRVQAVGNLFGNLGAIAMPWLFALTKLDCFRDGLQGVRVVGAGMGIILIVSGLIPFFLCRERDYVQVAGQKKMGLWQGLKITLSNRIFMLLMSVVLLAAFGFFTIMSISPYIIIYYVMGGDVKAASVLVGWNGTAWVLSSILFVAPVTWCATHFSKKASFIGFTVIHLFGHVSKIWCYNPAHPWLAVVPPILIAGGFVALWTIGASMIADICDADELETGARREGSYQSVFGWILKMAMSLALVIGGALLNRTGFDQALEGAQTAGAIRWMRLLEAGVPIAAILAALTLLLFYPLTEKRVYAIRREIEQRAK
jgi:GPH family glycoside/pentoside/hexuronide:cation symporter